VSSTFRKGENTQYIKEMREKNSVFKWGRGESYVIRNKAINK